MKRIAVPAFVTLLSVVSLIVANGWNRSSAPRLQITLTERELPRATLVDDGVEVRLRIGYQRRADPLDARNWLTEEKLRALGFAFDVLPGAPEAEDTYSRALPQIAWVAFEYDGAAWRDIERRRALEPPTSARPATTENSRLVPVDASLDLDTLLARHPSGHLMLRASIDLGYIGPKEKGPLVYAYIRNLIPSHVSVPHALKDQLRTLPDGSPPARYDVDLALGRMGIPYITDIRRLF